MATEKAVEKGISDIVGALVDPIIVYPGGWGEDMPDWLKTQITLERMVMNMKALKGEEPTGTDAEACAYLMSASLSFPMDHDWAQIYLYVATKEMRGKNKDNPPADIAVESISDYQMRKLKGLKDWIYRQRTKPRRHGITVARGKKEPAAKEEPALVQEKFF